MTLTEAQTRHVPYDTVEVSHARNRPIKERPTIPKPGDKVYYRREYWDQEPMLTTVVAVQDLNDKEDPNLWHLVRDQNGVPVMDDGVVRYAQVADPWPEVTLEWIEEQKGGDPAEITRRALTRESRLRGSPGWLPLNWRTRPVRLPSDLLLVPRPELPPLNVPLSQYMKEG